MLLYDDLHYYKYDNRRLEQSLCHQVMEKIVLKSGRAAAYAEDVTEFFLTCANGVKAYAQVKRSDNLGDVRSRIADFFIVIFCLRIFCFK